jgi:tetratricopeptide (TPR) repeat protein
MNNRTKLLAAAGVLVLGSAVAYVLLFRTTVEPELAAACRVIAPDSASRIDACTRVIAIDPKAGWAYAARAEAFLRRDDSKSALADARAAVKADPGLAAGYAMLAMTDFKAGGAKRMADARLAVKLAHERPMGGYEEGQALLAVSDATVQVAAETNQPSSDTDDAMKAARAAMEADVLSSVNQVNYAEALIRHWKQNEAWKVLNETIDMDPGYAKAYLLRAQTWSDADEVGDQAPTVAAGKEIEDLNKAIELEPLMAQSYIARGDHYVTWGPDDLATADYTRSIAIDPDEFRIGYVLAMQLLRTGHPEPALVQINIAIGKNPAWPSNRLARSLVYIALNRRADAIADIEQVLAENPDNKYQQKMLQDLKSGARVSSYGPPLGEFDSLMFPLTITARQLAELK